ncbi:glycosyltransferase [Chloroflexota bacterium]
MYPALAVLQGVLTNYGLNSGNFAEPRRHLTSISENDQNAVLWVGSEGGMEVGLVERAGVQFTSIPAAGLHGVGVRALPGNLYQLERGYRKSKRILMEFQPDVLFFTGGYVSVPMAFAGRKKPSLVFIPDVEPGLALKTITRFADRVALSTEDSREFFEDKPGLAVTGYPTRSNLLSWDKNEAKETLNLDSDVPTLLVFGGSKGARSINFALLNALPELLPDMQIIHISGELDWEKVQTEKENLAISSDYKSRYHPFPYLHSRMGAALTAADMVVSRAGASCLGEFPLFGLPAILIPYPHAWKYQQTNAQYLSRCGAALVLQDSDLNHGLSRLVREIMKDPDRRDNMSHAMRSLARPEAAASLAAMLVELANIQNPERN